MPLLVNDAWESEAETDANMINKLKRNEQLHKRQSHDHLRWQIWANLPPGVSAYPPGNRFASRMRIDFAIQSQSSVCDLHTHLYANRIGMSAKRFNFIAQQRENCNRGERESGKMGNGNGIHSPRPNRDPTHSEKATKIPWRKKQNRLCDIRIAILKT